MKKQVHHIQNEKSLKLNTWDLHTFAQDLPQSLYGTLGQPAGSQCIYMAAGWVSMYKEKI